MCVPTYGCPKVQASSASIAEGACLGGYDTRDIEYKIVVKGSTQGDRLGKGGGIAELRLVVGIEIDAGGVGHAVKSLGPPFVGGQAESLHT